jgi:hypothetical protein
MFFFSKSRDAAQQCGEKMIDAGIATAKTLDSGPLFCQLEQA